jgi:hypothetical protein
MEFEDFKIRNLQYYYMKFKEDPILMQLKICLANTIRKKAIALQINFVFDCYFLTFKSSFEELRG